MGIMEDKKVRKGNPKAIGRLRDKPLSQMSKKERTTYNNKKCVYKALQKSFNISDACNAAGIARSTYNSYLDSDPLFYELVDELRESQVDYVESKLTDRIKAEDTTAIIFFLKTRGKDRGYAQPKEVINHNQNYNANMSDKEYDMSKLSDTEMVDFHKLLTKMQTDNDGEK